MSTISAGRNHTERVEKWQSCRIERRNEFRELYDSSPHCSHAISFDVFGKISEPVKSVGAGLFGLVSLGRGARAGLLGLCCLENEDLG